LDLARKATQLGMTSTGEFLGYVKRQGDEEGVAGGRASEGEEETMAEGIQMEAMDRVHADAPWNHPTVPLSGLAPTASSMPNAHARSDKHDSADCHCNMPLHLCYCSFL
jgi:hypothetical protein